MSTHVKQAVDVTALVQQAPDDRAELRPTLEACIECGRQVRQLMPDHRCIKHSAFRPSVKEARERAKEIVERHQVEYAKLHLKGARVAAAKGDTRPAEWALTHGRSIEPVANKTDGGPNVVVIVGGAQLPGLPPATE